MPKAPRFTHPVRIVRNVLGLSQPRFAQKVGTSESTIKQIENGKLAVSRSLALRICAAANVEPASLMEKSGKPLDIWGQPYGPESLNKRKGGLPKDVTDASREKAGFYLNIALEAAEEKDRLPQVLLSFDEWLQQVREDFGLKPATSRILKERTRREFRGTMLGGQVWGAVRGFTLSAEESRKQWEHLRRNPEAEAPMEVDKKRPGVKRRRRA